MPNPTPSQILELHTPLGDDVFRVRSISVTEALGSLFEYNISALSTDKSVSLDGLLGKPVTVKLELPEGDPREFSGLVTRFAHVGFVGRLFEYQITVRPWLWLLTRSNNVRIFQNKTAVDIIKAVFQPYSPDFKVQLTRTFEQREYCVQYRESDFAFVSRLMEDEGIFYYFEHKDGKHQLVLVDEASGHEPVSGYETIHYRESIAGAIDLEAVTRWQFSQELRTGKVTLTDHFYESPTNSHQANSATKEAGAAPKFVGEYYDYNIGMGPNNSKVDDSNISKRSTIRERFATTRAKEFAAQQAQVTGETNARGMTVGAKFTLADFPADSQNADHLVVSTVIQAGTGEYEGQEGAAPYFHCQFTALARTTPYVSPQRTRKPQVAGPQTAVVVGASGDEIHTDKLGRVKVQFYWDREGQSDQTSSCWVRVSSPWAGKGWGMISLPRVGQEVVVDFLEGNPDLPLITGRVYNTDQTVPYTLPDNATVSTIKSRSSKNGDTSTFNELRFEDKKGDEYIWLQAEKDFKHLVKNDSYNEIGNDYHTDIKNDRKEKVGNDQHLHVVKDLKQKIDGDAHLQTGTDYMIKVGGQYSLKTTSDLAAESGAGVSFKASADVHIKGGANVTIEAGAMLTLKAGGSTIVLGPAGVSIVGTMVNVNSGGGGSGANPVAPSAPADPADPTKPEDPLAS